MARRLIGIDIDATAVRTALVDAEKGQMTLLAVQRFERDPETDLGALLRTAVGETRLGDRLAAALPTTAVFTRRLGFPFAEEKKIAAALPMELGLQLPIATDSCTLAFQRPQPGPQGYQVMAAAARNEAVAAFLAPFDTQELPLNILALAPFALARGLRDEVPNGILVSLAPRETLVILAVAGEAVAHRLLAIPADLAAPQLATEILRAGRALSRGAGQETTTFHLIGPGATPTLLEQLREGGVHAEIPRIEFRGAALAAEYLPALALARRAGISDRERGFNLRSGPFALKSEWGKMKKRLTAMAALLALILGLFAGSAYLGWAQKAAVAAALQKDIQQLFRETFPGSQAIVDAPLQMRAQLTELQRIGQRLGSGGDISALNALAEVSRYTPGDLTVDIRDLSYTPESVRLEGTTSSFDAINRLSRTLQGSPLFAEARIDDAKMRVDGSQVDFRLTLPLRKEP